jgi:hypothetical protein
MVFFDSNAWSQSCFSRAKKTFFNNLFMVTAEIMVFLKKRKINDISIFRTQKNVVTLNLETVMTLYSP